MSTRRRPVQLVASLVEVLCSHCGGHQPAPNGEAYWTIDELRKANPRERTCVDCDEPIEITPSRPHLSFADAAEDATGDHQIVSVDESSGKYTTGGES